MAQAIIEKFRIYANAFEAAVQNEDNDEYFGGWSDIIRQESDLLEKVIKMVKNRNNDEGRKMAVLLIKCKKESVRYIAEKIMKRENFEVVDRSNTFLQ